MGCPKCFSNPKARRIGDILTIKIVEASSATNKASTTTDRSSGISAQVNGLFNLENEISSSKSFNPPSLLYQAISVATLKEQGLPSAAVL